MAATRQGGRLPEAVRGIALLTGLGVMVVAAAAVMAGVAVALMG